MKRFMVAALAGVLVGLIILGWGWNMWTTAGALPEAGSDSSYLRIVPGMTLAAAADTLVARGLLDHKNVLLLGARLTGRARALKAGLYEVPFGLSPRELLLTLTRGLAVPVVLTIPEGLDRDEILAIVTEVFPFSAAVFSAAADSLARGAVVEYNLMGGSAVVAAHGAMLRASDPRQVHWSEGMLAPDTYHFAEGSSAPQVAQLMLTTQLDRLERAMSLATDGVNGNFTAYELLTLASLVESEARVAAERTRIAAVYSNRLQKRWRLEADPTVAFVLGKKGDRLYFKHLKVDSPYNTYRNKGLPPGPICTPGLASMLAAAQPDVDCDALYFVSGGADTHVFSRTLAEHEAAVRSFNESRRSQRQN